MIGELRSKSGLNLIHGGRSLPHSLFGSWIAKRSMAQDPDPILETLIFEHNYSSPHLVYGIAKPLDLKNGPVSLLLQLQQQTKSP